MPIPHDLLTARYGDIRSIRYQVAVLPWGATEAHNYHLPYGTDVIETGRLAADACRLAVAKGAKVIALPTVPFGANTGQLDIPLTINMNPSTQFAVLRDIVLSLERQGVPKLVVLNGHGGNDFKQMIRELSVGRSLLLCQLNWYSCMDLTPFFDDPGDHAGQMETSLMLHLAPDTVRTRTAGAGDARPFTVRAFREGWAWTPREWTRMTRDTGVGDPSGATSARGEAYFRALTERIASFLVDFARVSPKKLYAPRPKARRRV